MKKYQSLVAMGLIITVTMSGCVKMGETKSTQYSVQGCAVGGLGAGAVTYLANLGDKDAKKKAAIAGMLGCMAGAVVGFHIGKRTDEYANAQEAVRSEIVTNEEHVKKLQQTNAQLAQNIKDYNKEISMIKDSSISEDEKFKNFQKTKKIVSNQRDEATNSLKTAQADIIKAKEHYSTYQASAAPQDKSKWKSDIAEYEQERDILSEHVDTLTALDASI